MNDPAKVLVIGFGNPGRQDDGLGPALAKAVEDLRLPGVCVDADYQLTVEDAAEVAKYDVVIFADADVNGPEPFRMQRIQPGPPQVSFSTHSVRPEAVLALARDLFEREPRAYLLGIRGYKFDAFGEALSDGAVANLDAATTYLESALRNRELCETRAVSEDGLCHAFGTSEEDNPCKTANT